MECGLNKGIKPDPAARVEIQARLRLASDLIDRGYADQARQELVAIAQKNPSLLGDPSKIGEMSDVDLTKLVSTALRTLQSGTTGGEVGSGPTSGSQGTASLGVRRSGLAREQSPLPSAEVLAFGNSRQLREAALRACNFIRLSKGVDIADTIDLRLLAAEKWTTEIVGMVRATPKAKKLDAPGAQAVALVEHEGDLYSVNLMIRKKPTPQKAPDVQFGLESGATQNCTIDLYIMNLGDGSKLRFQQRDDFSRVPAELSVARAIAVQLYAQRGEELPSIGFLRSQPGDESFLAGLKAVKVRELVKVVAAGEIGQLLERGSRAQGHKEWDYMSASASAHANPFRGASRR